MIPEKVMKSIVLLAKKDNSIGVTIRWYPHDGDLYFSGEGDEIHFVIDYKNELCVDRADCFDKASKCPIILPLPKNEKQEEFLNSKLDWLLTEEGYKASNEYDFDLWVKSYPEG